MITQYKPKLLTSFYMWLDYTLQNNGQFRETTSSPFYLSKDYRVAGKVAYSSMFKEWVYDSGFATLPSGVFINGNFIAENQSGLKLDFQNGRILLDSSSGISGVSGDFSYKTVNTYLVTDFEREIWNQQYRVNGRFMQNQTGVEPYMYTVPACFIQEEKSENVPFQLGGTDESVTKLQIFTISDNNLVFQNINSILQDLGRKHFPIFDDIGVFPLNELGGLKTGYSYESLLTGNMDLAYLSKVTVVPISNSDKKSNYKFSITLVEIKHPRLNF